MQLLSKLPTNPIETPAPDVWAWGRHPNGLDYKARHEGGADLKIVYENNYRAGIFIQSMGARNRVGVGLSYRPARLYRLAEFTPWNRFLGSMNF